MISIGAQRRVFVSTRPVDFRKGVHGLVALVAEDLKCNPYCGDIYVFRAKRKDRLKLRKRCDWDTSIGCGWRYLYS